MPIFHLKPIVAMLDDPAWSASTHRKDVWVNAASEKEARDLATGKLENGEANLPGAPIRKGPWLSSTLVEVHEVSAAPSDMKIPNNTVVAA
jgi:hypothetical protein